MNRADRYARIDGWLRAYQDVWQSATGPEELGELRARAHQHGIYSALIGKADVQTMLWNHILRLRKG